MRHFSRWPSLVLVLLILSWSVEVAASPLCKSLFRGKRYKKAALCFSLYVKSLEDRFAGPPSSLSLRERNRMFQGLRNVALSYHRAAKNAKPSKERSFLLEQAYLSMQKILKHRYYEYPSQRKLSLSFANKLKAAIGYANVVVHLPSKHDWVRIEGGFRFKALRLQGPVVRLALRPGRYLLVAHRKKGGVQRRKLQLKQGQSKLVVLLKWPALKAKRWMGKKRAPQASASWRTAATWTFVGVGAAALVTGSALLASSVQQSHVLGSSASELQSARLSGALFQGEPPAEKHSLALTQALSQNEAMYAAGWVVGGAGLAMGVAGLIFYVTHAPKRVVSAPASTAKSARSQSILLFP